MSDLAIDESALEKPHSSYARIARLLRRAGEEAGLEVQGWRGGSCPAPVLWVPQLAWPASDAERVVVTLHDVNPLLPDGRPAWQRLLRARRFRATARRALRPAWRVATGSEDARARIARAFPFAADRLRVVPWFPDPAFVPGPEPRDAAVLQRLGLEPGYLLFLGALRRHKNWQTAVRAWAALPESLRARHPLVLAGSRRRAGDAPERLAARLGVQAGLRTLEHLDDADLPALYRGARVFLFPSRLEGFGLPPLEALACGVPVVAARATSLPEVLGEGAALCDPDAPAEFAAAARRLLEDARAWESARAAALARAERFTPRATGAAMRALLSGDD